MTICRIEGRWSLLVEWRKYCVLKGSSEVLVLMIHVEKRIRRGVSTLIRYSNQAEFCSKMGSNLSHDNSVSIIT